MENIRSYQSCHLKFKKKSLVEFELDLEKMPLGKLSHDQLKKAYGILTRLMENIKVRNHKKYIILYDISYII